MKKRLTARRALATGLAALWALGMLAVLPPGARAEEPPPPPRITKYSTPALGFTVGTSGVFTFNVTVPAGVTLVEAVMESGSAFVFQDGSQVLPLPPLAEAFTVTLRYIGGSSIVITLLYKDSTDAVWEHTQTILVSQTIDLPVPTWEPPPPEPPPQLPVMSVSGDLPGLTAGRNGEITFRLRNDSSYSASNVTVSLSHEAELFRPTSLTGSEVRVGSVSAGASRDVKLPVNVMPDVQEGYYAVQFKITGTSQAGAIDQTAFIQVHITNSNKPAEDKTPPALSVTSSTLDKNTPGGDGILKLTVSVRNTGQQNASDVRVTLTGLGKGALTLNESLPTKVISTLAAGASASVTYELKAPPELESDIYEPVVNIRFRQPDGTEGAPVTETLYLSIIIPPKPPEARPPALAISSSFLESNIPDANGALKLTVEISNTGQQNASDVRITLQGLTEAGLMLDETQPTKTVGALAAGASAELTFALKATGGLETRIHRLTADIQYRTPDGKAESVDGTLFLYIIKPPDPTSGERVRMSAMRQDVTDPGRSNTVTVTLSFRNFGTDSARDAAFAFKGLNSSSFTLLGSFGDRQLGSIGAGETVSLSVPLHVAAELNNGNHQLETALTYTDALGETKTVETAVYIYISRPEPPPTPPPTTPPSPDASIPRVIISHHSVSEPVVTAGGPFELHFTLTNTSRVKDIKNMKVTVTDEQGIFLPVAGVNSFYVEELGIGGLVSLSIHLTPKQDAESKSYPVTLSLAYEDRENAQYNVSESLSIPVYQPQRLEVSNLLFFGDGMGGAQLNFQFINKGKSTLYNMTVRVEGPMALMEGDYFVGNFPAGAMDYFEDALLIESYGEVSGWLVMQYEDAAGAALEYRQELSAWIDGGFDPGPWDPGPWEPAPWPDPEPGEGEGGTILGLAPWLFWTLLGVVLALAAGTVVTVVLVSKKRRAKEMMEDDE